MGNGLFSFAYYTTFVRLTWAAFAATRMKESRRPGENNRYFNRRLTDKQAPKVGTLAEGIQVCGYELLLRGHDTEIVIDQPDKEDE